MGGWSLSRQLRAWGRTHPGQDRVPSHRRATHTRPHSLRQGRVSHGSSPHMSTFGTWEGTGVPAETPRGHGERTYCMRTWTRAWNWFFFSLINVIIKQCWMKQRYLRTSCKPFTSCLPPANLMPLSILTKRSSRTVVLACAVWDKTVKQAWNYFPSSQFQE